MKVKLYKKVLREACSFQKKIVRLGIDVEPPRILSHDACSTFDPDDKLQYAANLAFVLWKEFQEDFTDVIRYKYRKYSRKWNMSSSKLKRAIFSGSMV